VNICTVSLLNPLSIVRRPKISSLLVYYRPAVPYCAAVVAVVVVVVVVVVGTDQLKCIVLFCNI